MELLLDCLLDAGMDTLKLIPFLFVTYLVMEWIERRAQNASGRLIQHRNSGALGPVFGAVLGAVPQCGFSAAASSLYSGGLISLGTLLAVFLSTSDEMLPLLISAQVPVTTMLEILASKAGIGLITGLAADFALRRLRGPRKIRPASKGQGRLNIQESRHPSTADPSAGAAPLPSHGRGADEYVTDLQLEPKRIHDLCEEEHCGCEEDTHGVLRSALVHTVHIVIFVFLITFALTLLVEGFGEDVIRDVLSGRSAPGIFLAAALGLIPNCASSILITQLYLDGLIAAGQMMAGLLVGAGVGLLVLFRTNTRHLRENVTITLLLYILGVLWGFVITGLGVNF